MAEVVVVNIHGGFPSAMVDKALHELRGFARLARVSEVNDRVYPTNACAGPTLHDTIMDAPMGTMADSVWHPWAFCRHASRTLFHVFKQANYNTRLFGAFGLDVRLDPHTHMHFHPSNLHAALQSYGIDVCDAQDAAFTCQLGFAHDKDVMRRVVEYLRRPSDANRFTVVNLLGCQDAHKCAFHDVDPEKVAIPVMNLDASNHDASTVYDERCFATNVVDDDVRKTGSQASGIEALRRSALLKDWIRGCEGSCDRQELVRVVNGLHQFCWKCLQEIDRGLCEVLDALEKTNRFDEAVVFLYSDHPISLYEHGELCEAPWEACLRSFVIRKCRRSATASRSSAPFSIARLPAIILHDAGIFADWHISPKSSNCCVTLGLACSWLVRARMQPPMEVTDIRTFFIRVLVSYNHRPYAFTFWFGLNDLFTDENRPPMDHVWANPVLDGSLTDFANRNALQVYEHTSDPYETKNLADMRPWLLGDSATHMKEMINDELVALNLRELRFKIPEKVLSLSVNHVSFCSVQLHHRIRDRMRALSHNPLATPQLQMRHAHTQTDDVSLHDALLQTYGAIVGDLIQTHVSEHALDAPLTVFAPYEDVETTTEWPGWALLPLRGVYTKDTMLKVAQHGISVTDAVTGASHIPTGFDAENVFFKSCRVLLKTAVNIFHSRGIAIGYRVFRDESHRLTEISAESAQVATEKTDEENRAIRVSPPSTPFTQKLGMSRAATIRARSSGTTFKRIDGNEGDDGTDDFVAKRQHPPVVEALELQKALSPRAFRGKNVASSTPVPVVSRTVTQPAVAKAVIKRSSSASRKSVRQMEQAQLFRQR